MAPTSRPADFHDTRLLVFAKAPIPGQVKTRLMPDLSADACARLHRRLIVRGLTTALAANLGPVELWCAPDCTHPFFAACARRFGIVIRAQQGEDLGARMYLALAASLRQAQCAVIIGCDCPALDARYLSQACGALARGASVVLGPAEDGGYVLIGLRRVTATGTPARKIFEDIAWGGSMVLAQTRERLRACGLSWRELPPLWDVDRPADLARLHEAGFRTPTTRRTTRASRPWRIG
ncbi:MAG: TIGR04282 family arsenosugar biosynthesis glycosyltransferase [Gammaproteobacteria bacterium]